jgi:autotransporter-associated beta strand protein
LGLLGSNGIVNISSGTFTLNNAPVTVGANNSSGFGVVNLSGTAVFNMTASGDNGMWVAETGSGVLNVSDTATLTIATGNTGLVLAHDSGSGAGTGTGIVNLLGGTVTVSAVSKGASTGPGTLNFNGGTLKANADNATFLTGLTKAYVFSGGAIIDDGGKAITVGQALLAPTGNGVRATGLTVSGGGFIDTPLVTITNATGDSTGAGATAIATINSDGTLAGITITNPGTGYTAAPTFALVGGGIGNTGSIGGTATLVANASGGLTKLGAGTMTLTASSSYTGATTISNGVLELVSGGDISASSPISTATSATFEINGGDHTVGTISGTGTTSVLSGSLTATSIVQGTLNIGFGTGDTLDIATFDGGSTSGSSLTQVPEPATWTMLMLAAMGLGIYRHRNRLGLKNLNFSG